MPGLSHVLEGAIRPGHFRGVATVVLALFEIVRPDLAVFGQKDYQQQLLIRRMVEDLHVPVEIVTEPTVREADGLAMSSRNRYLDAEERKAAAGPSRALGRGREAVAAGERDADRVRQILDGDDRIGGVGPPRIRRGRRRRDARTARRASTPGARPWRSWPPGSGRPG